LNALLYKIEQSCRYIVPENPVDLPADPAIKCHLQSEQETGSVVAKAKKSLPFDVKTFLSTVNGEKRVELSQA
jgi:hypothetical protein